MTSIQPGPAIETPATPDYPQGKRKQPVRRHLREAAGGTCD
jgi:hypothetical protein